MSCDRFEELFIKESQKELLEHILHCRDCRYEYEKMQKTEMVLKEARPYFAKQKRMRNKLKTVVSIGLFLLLSTYLIQNNPLNQYNDNYVAHYTVQDSSPANANLPVDEYGLLDID